MLAKEFWQTVVRDRDDLLGRLLALFSEHEIKFCVIGGQGVNAFADPVVSLDLDIAIVANDLPKADHLLRQSFHVDQFEHSLNVSGYGSDLRVQIRTDPRYADFPDRAEVREVLGLRLPVASLPDLLTGKLWAVLDATRRPSKRQKDLADIARLIEAHPELRSAVPEEVRERLFWDGLSP